MSFRDQVQFVSGDPGHLFEAASEAALRPLRHELHGYPEDPFNYWRRKFAEQAVPVFLQEARILNPALSGDPAHSISFASGVLHAVTMTMDLLVNGARRLNVHREKNDKPVLKPVILAPMPNYTFPLNHLHDIGVDVISLPRNMNDNWSLKPEQVAAMLADIRREGKYLVVAFYDNNPNNPTGFIRDQDEVARMAAVFHEHNAAMDIEDKALRCGPHHGSAHFKMSHRLTVLDDMIYMGLEHTGKKPASFLSDPQTANDTVTFLGISKYGMAGFRGGLIVTNPFMNRRIFSRYWETIGYAPLPSLLAVMEVFSGHPPKMLARETHINRLNAAHMDGFKLMSALVNGLSERELSSSAGQVIMREVMNVIPEATVAAARLRQGIPGLKIKQPDAGFFTFMDASDLHGARLPSDIEGFNKGLWGKRLDSGATMHKLFSAFGVRYMKPKTLGLAPEILMQRANFALPKAELIKGLERTRAAIESLEIKQPSRRSQSREARRLAEANSTSTLA